MAAGAAERERKERHRKKLGRTQSLGFIPLGLTVDYSVEYGAYVDKAIAWTPEDADDFLFPGKVGKLSATEISYFHKAWSEIQAMEACQSYGIADYKFDM